MAELLMAAGSRHFMAGLTLSTSVSELLLNGVLGDITGLIAASFISVEFIMFLMLIYMVVGI